jgi:hypothetical protein
MRELRERIQGITEQLHSLTQELAAANDAPARELVEEVLGSELMFEFKCSIDAVRHLVFIYIEAHSQKQTGTAALSNNSEKLARATKLLKTLDGGSGASPDDSSVLFLESIQSVVDRYSQKIDEV